MFTKGTNKDYRCADKFEVEFGYEFAESVFEHSKRNFYKSGENPVLYNNLVLIIKTVMGYE